ncbi:MAG: ABC transporter ATP-binding protein [Phycisphaerales bacterium]|nr:ABC transporter ATP-binding protein [Phycisphaerales bacterium]
MAQVSLQHVRKVYAGGAEGLRGFSLDIADGELVVLFGPSGCGKSTTVRLIAGLESPTEGTIRIGGRDVAGVPPRDRGVAMVSQGSSLYPHMTVRRNLEFPLRVRRMPVSEVRSRVARTAEGLGIEGLLDRKPARLSGGERQRAALGRALVQQPRVFLMDEPLSDLDASLRADLRQRIRALQRRLHTTLVYVTHDQEEALALADRLVVLSRGLLQQAAPPREVYERPANRCVAGAVGSPVMNFFRGAVRGGRVQVAGSWLGVGSPTLEGRDVVVGVRPSALRESATGSLSITVSSVELLGESVDVVGDLGAVPVAARLPARDGITIGQPLRLDATHVMAFEPGEFGARLFP